MRQPRDTTQRPKAMAEDARLARARRHAEMLVLMRGLARRYKNLVNRISKAEINATFIEYEMFQLLKMMEELIDEGTDDLAGNARQKVTSAPLRILAESGASSLEIKPRPDGMADVRIDGGKQFTLPPMLTDLLAALSMDNGFSEDAFVGWKSVREIAEYLSKPSGKPMSKRAVTQGIYRLRKELFDRGGVNPYLIQTNRSRGLRFAFRRKVVPAIVRERAGFGD